jgi:nitrogen regulatory protein P-II 2
LDMRTCPSPGRAVGLDLAQNGRVRIRGASERRENSWNAPQTAAEPFRSRKERAFCLIISQAVETRRAGSSMKFIVAVIKPFKLDEVREALDLVGVHGMTVSEVKGYGRQKGHTEVYRGAEYVVAFLPKARLEIAVPDDRADAAVEAIRAAAATGQIGDGKIFVLSLGSAMRIRTGETDDDAL